MSPDKLLGADSGAEKPEEKPINRLIRNGENQLPSHFERNFVLAGRVVENTEKGDIGMDIMALPPEDNKNAFGRFWDKVKSLRKKQTEEEPIPPTPVAARPAIHEEDFIPGQHVGLVKNMPYIVLENGTRYGISVTAPASLVDGEWEEFEEEAESEGLFKTSNLTEIGRRKKGLAIAARTDNGQPLIRENIGRRNLPVFHEMLKGFVPTEDPSLRQALITHRATAKGQSELQTGESAQKKTLLEPIIFSSLKSNEGVGTEDDKKGMVEVVVYEVYVREVREIIEKPLPQMLSFRDSADSILRGGGLMKGGIPSGSRLSAGETTFAKGKSEKVDIKGVKLIKPIAAFRVALVGELPDEQMELPEDVNK